MDTLRAEAAAAREQRRRRAWLRRILECIVATVVVAVLATAQILLDAGNILQFLLVFAVFAAAVIAGIYWASSTGRLLRAGVFHLTGFLIPLVLVTMAAGAAGGAVLALDGTTATCTTVRVEPMKADVFGNDWRHVLSCPDGTTLEVSRKEEDDSALRGPLVYQPAGWVPPEPLATFEQGSHAGARWAFLIAAGAFLLQFTAAVTSGLIRRGFTTQHPDDKD
ncbi:hypothetical protein ACTI_82560 [Actinoplanes sp. OR16]|uniref:hypothetical protein n=1 Tax=Actinoplanes sp. OR16 TaxID=946334 RepID=UPI000F703472|nr:hypothetical protein [Actinoplanes sp. OR16]BBH71571.1 hypothetical protein ACTI_82560 [Actinoplanes sp. OR16]